jgi:hypothetical protein
MPGCEQGCLRGRWSIAAGGSQSSNTIAHFALAFSRKESVCVGKAGEDLMNALRIVACLAGLRSRYHHVTRWTSGMPSQCATCWHGRELCRRETAEAGSNLMSLYSINDPKHWLDRAKEARALAEQMDNPEAKRTMLKNADDYERLAQRAEERAAGRWSQSK